MVHYLELMLMGSWKLLLTVALLGAIGCSVFWRAPKVPIEREELRRLVFSAVVLYAVGALASISDRGALAGVVYASGILVCSLAVWLSRGIDRGDGGEGPGDDGPPDNEHPPPGPDGTPAFDWDAFERDLRNYVEGQGTLTR
jgi:hypothetical protein